MPSRQLFVLVIALAAGRLAAGAPVPHAPAPSARSQIVRQVLRASVRVQVFEHGELRRSATGVVVPCADQSAGADASCILTNAHVVDSSELKDVTYAVLLEKRARVVKTLPARLVAEGQVPDLDLALLSVDAELPRAVLGTEEGMDVGDDVVVVGAPYGRSLSISGGLISQLDPAEGSETASPGAPPRYKGMKTDAAVGYGCSGGGVFELATGELVGIVEGYRTARVAIDDHTAFDIPMPGETFVAPITKVRDFLAHVRLPAIATTISGATPPEPAGKTSPH